MMKHTLAVVAVGFMCSVAVGEARVTRIEVVKVEPVPAAQANGQAVPPYERISGRFYGELDPRDPKNALITDPEGNRLTVFENPGSRRPNTD